MTIVESTRPVTGGVDTHLEVHVAAAVDTIGGLLGVGRFRPRQPGSPSCRLASGFGPVERVGVEGHRRVWRGPGALSRRVGVSRSIEVDRPNRQERRRDGKSDELDAIEAARAALSGRASGQAKGGTTATWKHSGC